MPVKGIHAKMRTDGMDRNDIEAFMRVHASPSELEAMGLGAKSATPRKLKPVTRRASLRNLHWEPLSGDALDQSVWATPREGAAGHLAELEQQDIDQLQVRVCLLCVRTCLCGLTYHAWLRRHYSP